MDEPPGRTLPRRLGVLLAAIPLLAVLLADAAIVARHATRGSTHKPGGVVAVRPRTGPTLGPADRAARARARAIRVLLARRGDAVVHHNRGEWMSTVDPQQSAFRAAQAHVFDNLAAVPFLSWSYTFDSVGELPPTQRSLRYGVPSWTPRQFSLRYRIRGFDTAPTNLAQYPTFVQRGGAWYLASLTDFAVVGDRSSVDIWDFGPVRVVRSSRVMVLGHPQSLSLMRSVDSEVESDMPRVDAVWTRPWMHRVVVLVPATQHELGEVVDDTGNLDHIAAVASAEVQTAPGRPNPVGDRIGINPRNWPKLSPLGREIVLTHELTHVATRAYTGEAAPSWLVEGFADYVGYLDTGVPTTVAAQELAADVRAGRVPRRLPTDAQFDGGSAQLAQAYEGAWLANRLIAQRWGQAALVRLYVSVGTSSERPGAALATGMRGVLHTTPAAFIRAWRAFLRSELS